MNTPNDASDTAINRLFDDEAGVTKAKDKISADADAEAARAVGEQLTDIVNYLALVSDIKLNPAQAQYFRDCLSCCFYQGVYFGATRELS